MTEATPSVLEFGRWVLDPSVPVGSKLAVVGIFGGSFAVLAILAAYVAPIAVADARAMFGEVRDNGRAIVTILRSRRKRRVPRLEAAALVRATARDTSAGPRERAPAPEPGAEPIVGTIPPAVLRSLRQMYPAARDLEGGLEAEDADTLEVTFYEGDLYRCATLRLDGALVHVAEDVTLSELPEPVRRTIQGVHGAHADVSVTRLRRPDRDQYEAGSMQGERELVSKVDADGRLLERFYREGPIASADM
jgi:hypothetical protein